MCAAVAQPFSMEAAKISNVAGQQRPAEPDRIFQLAAVRLAVHPCFARTHHVPPPAANCGDELRMLGVFVQVERNHPAALPARLATASAYMERYSSASSRRSQSI